MKIELRTKHITAPSTVLNRSLLEKIPAEFTFNNGYKNKNVILFMGYDPNIEEAREENEDALIGIIDPRPKTEHLLHKANFWLANGIESVNKFISLNPRYFIYPIYPPYDDLNWSTGAIKDKGEIIISYHGNLNHLKEMELTVCAALERLASDFKIRLHVVYNMNNGGKWKWQPGVNKLEVDHIQWYDNVYFNELLEADIGIVPAIKPTSSSEYGQLVHSGVIEPVDYIQRYKYTTNMGRILVFAQIGVPVVADMYPSSAELIRHGYNGLLATDADSWYWHLKTLIERKDLRKKMAENMLQVFNQYYHWDVKNNELLNYIRNFGIDISQEKKKSIVKEIKKLFQ